MPTSNLRITKETRVLGFVFSGFFTVLLQRTPSKCLVCFTLACNVISACTAVTGLIFLTLELGVLGSVPDGNAHWPEKSGELLSQYLWLFVSLELVVTCIVIHWLCKAKYRT